MERKQIEVVAAVIVRDNKVFATQRGYGDWKGWWEFPGGKVEPGETYPEALVREIKEELATEIKVGENLATAVYDYPKFQIKMHCFLCSIVSGNLTLLEHEDSRWLSKDELLEVKWLPADEEIISKLSQMSF